MDKDKALFVCHPRCSTCQKARKWLEQNDISFTERSIIDNNPSKDEIGSWLQMSGKTIGQLFNTSGMKYRELNLKDKVKTASLEELISILSSDGMLVKRPILITKQKAYFGFKEKEWTEILN